MRVNLDKSLQYLQGLTDGEGILEHAKYHYPRRSEGYSTDDNARAYQVMLRLRRSGKPYLQFLTKAWEGSGFHNDLSFEGTWLDCPGWQEWSGRAIAALGEGSVRGQVREKNQCEQLLQEVLTKLPQLESPRVIAQVIWGLSWQPQPALLASLADKLVAAYTAHSDTEWKWFERGVFYDNGKLPGALFKAYEVAGQQSYLQTATQSLDFLLKISYHPPLDCLVFPGNEGWWKRNKPWELFDQQPVEAGSMVEACVQAFKVTGKAKYKKAALMAWDWYQGRNLLRMSLVDEQTGASGTGCGQME
jgi:hypothetical protein